MQTDNTLHARHRNRLKRRFMKEGLTSFEKHNMLELLLFYSIPRRDTNEIAHRLVSRFGSLSGVFDAPPEELCQVEGVGENTAILIKLVSQLWFQYNLDKAGRRLLFSEKEELSRYLCNLYAAIPEETVFALYFNAREQLICAEKLFCGSVESCIIRKRRIVESGIRVGASFFVLTHNHPHGDANPSESDIRATQSLVHLFRELEMPMADHIIVSGNVTTSIRDFSGLNDAT